MTFRTALERFHDQRVLVVGDLMIDEYIYGSVGRISPEAPVMVVHQLRTARVPGGAANVALNLLALGAKPIVLGIAGADHRILKETLSELPHQLVIDSDRVTTRKTRIVAEGRHQLLRIDHESSDPAPDLCESELIAGITHHAPQVDAILLSDYCKGTLTPAVIRAAFERAGGKPVIVNAKPATFDLYRGATLISLNRAEATAALGHSFADPLPAAAGLAARVAPTGVLITLGAEGMVAVQNGQTAHVRAPRVEVADPAGAGDTVIAAVTLGMATLGFTPETFELAAHLAASVVQHVGVAVPTAADLTRLEGLESGILSHHASEK